MTLARDENKFKTDLNTTPVRAFGSKKMLHSSRLYGGNHCRYGMKCIQPQFDSSIFFKCSSICLVFNSSCTYRA